LKIGFVGQAFHSFFAPEDLWKPLLPMFRISSSVDHSDYFHLLRHEQVEDLERESADQGPPHFSVYLRMTHRIFFDLLENRPELRQELETQTLLSFFIPIELLRYISFRL
jgi:hypothetical protein